MIIDTIFEKCPEAAYFIKKQNGDIVFYDKHGNRYKEDGNYNFPFILEYYKYYRNVDEYDEYRKRETIDARQPIGNTIALLNKWYNDFIVNELREVDRNVLHEFLSWKRKDIIDYLQRFYKIINEI